MIESRASAGLVVARLNGGLVGRRGGSCDARTATVRRGHAAPVPRSEVLRRTRLALHGELLRVDGELARVDTDFTSQAQVRRA